MYFRFKTGDFFSKSTAKVLLFAHTAKKNAQKRLRRAHFSRFVHNTLFYGLLIFYAIQLVTPSAVAIADRIEMAV